MDQAYFDIIVVANEQHPPVKQTFVRAGYFYDKPRDLAEQLTPTLKKYDPGASISFNNITKRFDFKGSGLKFVRTQEEKSGEWWSLSNRQAAYLSAKKIGIYNLFVYTIIIH